MDPFYSPGMDWISFTTTSAAELITAQRRGEPMAQRIERYNHDFALSHRSWFESVYKDKYEYMGEWDLMSLAFRLDLGLYYLGMVSQPVKLGLKALLSATVYHLLILSSLLSDADLQPSFCADRPASTAHEYIGQI
jgi:hypothetical protein